METSGTWCGWEENGHPSPTTSRDGAAERPTNPSDGDIGMDVVNFFWVQGGAVPQLGSSAREGDMRTEVPKIIRCSPA